MRTRIGAGAGFAGDRIDPAVRLVEHGDLDHIVFECLGERTVAAGTLRRLTDPDSGYDPLLAARLHAVLPAARSWGTGIVTNSGAAHPVAAARVAAGVVRRTGCGPVRVGVVTGDDVLDAVLTADPLVDGTGRPVSDGPAPVSAHAYLGAEPITEALGAGADLVVTGRVADPSLYLGTLRHSLGWDTGDPAATATGTVVGHLLECAGQLTGGYFADPVTKPVPGLARLGFPFADVGRDGGVVLGKLRRDGGRLDRRTCAEQLLYEVGDPSSYVTPDVVADFSGVVFDETGPDQVRVSGASGRGRPDRLKVTLGYRGGWVGEGQISYAGPRCLDRARLAGDVVRERLREVHGFDDGEVEVEYLGAGAAHRGLAGPGDPVEVRLRVAARAPDRERAGLVGWEVESLYTNGPAAGGGARSAVTEQVVVRSCLLDRDLVRPRVDVEEVR
jgi:hypothetical protein